MHCQPCGWHHDDAPDWAHTINHNILILGKELAIVSTNQEHLDQDVAAIATAFAQAIAELKAQIAAGATPEQLDFTAADALVATVQGEAAADAPAETPPADQTPTA